MPRVAKRIPVLKDRAVQPDVQHAALMELGLSQAVAAAVWRGAGNSRHFIFPSPVEAPYCDFSAVNTQTIFNMGDTTTTHDYVPYGVAWRMTENFGTVMAVIVTASLSPVTYAVQLGADDLVDAVAASNSDYKLMQQTYQNPMGYWGAEEYDWRTVNPVALRSRPWFSSHVCQFTPTLPASRVVQLTPYAKITSAEDSSIDVGNTPRVYLRSMTILDIPDNEVG